jgi:membrane protein
VPTLVRMKLSHSALSNMAVMASPRQVWTLVKQAAQAWVDDYAPSMGAALAYYTVFSLAPLLLIVISVAGLVFGPDAVRGEIFGELRDLMGDDAAKAVEGLLVSVSKPAQSVAATLIGVGVVLIGATSVFGELQDALDRIWRAPARAKTNTQAHNQVGSNENGLWLLLRARLLSFGMILGLAFLLMVSLMLSALMAALGTWWGSFFGGWSVLAQVINGAVSFALTAVVFGLIYKLMPRVSVLWSDVALGALGTAVLFTLGKELIGAYIGKTGVASGFGAAGSIVIVLVWVYYSSQIFLLGAEFTRAYAHSFGSMRGQVEAPQAPAHKGLPA